MKAIVAVDENNGIGKNGNLLFHIKEDMKRFRQITFNHHVLMGRKTFESLPNGKPLKNRINLVMTSDNNYNKEGIITINSIYELQDKILKKVDTNDIFVIGGEKIYHQLLKYCDCVYLTKVYANGNADTFFPELDNKYWMFEMSSIKHDKETNLNYQFIDYHRY